MAAYEPSEKGKRSLRKIDRKAREEQKAYEHQKQAKKRGINPAEGIAVLPPSERKQMKSEERMSRRAEKRGDKAAAEEHRRSAAWYRGKARAYD